MNMLQAIVYGIVQGLTEFLPISSSAHLRIVPALLNWPDPGAAFTANVQIGTLIAVLYFFRKDLSAVVSGLSAGLKDRSKRSSVEFILGQGMIIGTVPIIVFGLLLKHYIERDLRDMKVVAAAMIVLALILWAAEKVGRKNRAGSDLTVKDGLIIGLWQALALIPGCSRSGSTISGGLVQGFQRFDAARISFLLSIPSIFLAAVYEAYGSRKEFSGIVPQLLVANVVSGVVGFICIAWLMKLLQTKTTMPFIIYRVALGIALFAMIAQGIKL